MIIFDKDKNIGSIYFGNKQIAAIYLGNKVIFLNSILSCFASDIWQDLYVWNDSNIWKY